MNCKDCEWLKFGYDKDFDMKRMHCTFPSNSNFEPPCEVEQEPTYEDYYNEMVASRGDNWW